MSDTNLTDFLKRNSSLFTALGVFGAISVYFTRLDVESRWKRLGVVSSLTIFIGISYAIQRNIPPKSSDKNSFDYITNNLLNQTPLLLFYVSFYALTISAIAVIVNFSGTFIFLLQFIITLFGFGTVVWWVSRVNYPDDGDPKIGVDRELTVYIGYVLRNAAHSLIIGSGILTLTYIRGYLRPDAIVELRISSPISALTVGFSSGMVAAGILYMSTFFPVLIAHILLSRLDLQKIMRELSEYSDAQSNEVESEESM